MSIIVPKEKSLTKNDKKTEKQGRRSEPQVLGVLVGFDFRFRVITEI
jgi:hypothetical protein